LALRARYSISVMCSSASVRSRSSRCSLTACLVLDARWRRCSVPAARAWSTCPAPTSAKTREPRRAGGGSGCSRLRATASIRVPASSTTSTYTPARSRTDHGRRPPPRDPQEGHLPHPPPLVRHPPPPVGLRYPDRQRAGGPPQREDQDDLHPTSPSWARWACSATRSSRSLDRPAGRVE